MSDARHACRRNSVHSDVVAIGQKTHKIVAHEHITKDDDRCSQRHEMVGTVRIYDHFKERNLKVVDHAHDRNTSVNKHVREHGVNNSNDRWHVAKSIGKAMKKLTAGAKKHHGVTWHTQLKDKCAGVRNHFYWAMDHCAGNAVTLKGHLDSIVPHYQNVHDKCVESSPCRQEGYTPDWDIITDQIAVKLLSDYVRSSVVYKTPHDYIYGRDTFLVESYNNTVLMYLDKRIHYQDRMYKLRRDLSVLDWNEHVDRPYSSISLKLRPDHTRRKAGKRVLRSKTYAFVTELWQLVTVHHPRVVEHLLQGGPLVRVYVLNNSEYSP